MLQRNYSAYTALGPVLRLGPQALGALLPDNDGIGQRLGKQSFRVMGAQAEPGCQEATITLRTS